MSPMLTPFEVKSFYKGVTDNYLAGPIEAGQRVDNLLINNNQKLFTRPGSVIRDEDDDQIPSGIKRIGYLFDHRDQIFELSEGNFYYFTTSYQTLVGPTSNNAFDTATESNYYSRAFWNNHSFIVNDSFDRPVKIYKDGSDVFQLRTAGLPALASSPTVTAGGAGTNNYIYAFLYYFSYTVEGVAFEDFGPTTQVSLSNAAAPDSSTVSITGIPVLSNTTVNNWDTTSIKVKIYRTENDQTVLKFIGEITNGTTTYNDSASDASITNNVVIYTTGDVVDNDPAPPAKFIHITNDIAMYGYVKESGVEIPNKIRQSIKGDPDSCPEDFFDLLEDEIMGISSFKSIFIVFCKNSIYRLDGFFDEQGRNGISHTRISDVIGTVSNDSIVQTDLGLFFAAQQGWYFTDGWSVQKISHHLDLSYPALVDIDSAGRNIWGAFDKLEGRIFWTTQRETSSNDNDSCYVLDLNWKISDESSFTTISGGTSFQPTALLFKGTDMYRADTRGYLLRHSSDLFTDPRIDTTANASDWAELTIIHDYISCAFDFGTTFVRKFVPKILATFKNITNIAIQIYGINDDGKSNEALSQIRYNSNCIWRDPEPTWGDPTIIWNQTGLIDEKRMFPATTLRCNYKQVRITNAFTIIKNSDTLSEGVVNNTLKTVTLTNAASAWPSASVGYVIAFENDDYTNEFEITVRNSDTKLTFLDATNLAPNDGTYKWLLKGYRKGEFMNPLSYVIHYKMLTDSQKSFHNPADTGENAS